MNDDTLNLKNIAEAIIFVSGEPVERLKLTEALGCTSEELDTVLKAVAKDYADRKSAIELLCLGSQVQFVTRPEYAGAVRSALEMKRNQPLSSAAFEVLAIVAYNQPVTRAFIEQVRGVDCGGVINTLCQRKLIEEGGRLDLPGRPLVYCTTTDFLKCFCMSTLAELPEIHDSKTVSAALENIYNDADADADAVDGQLSAFQ